LQGTENENKTDESVPPHKQKQKHLT
jgi:hypothetical protein